MGCSYMKKQGIELADAMKVLGYKDKEIKGACELIREHRKAGNGMNLDTEFASDENLLRALIECAPTSPLSK